MSASNIPLSSGKLVASEQISQVELVGGTKLVEVQQLAMTPIGPACQPLQVFATNGGSPELRVDGSATPVQFSIAPADPDIYRLDSLRLTLVTSAAIELTQFGNVAALADGILLQVYKDATLEHDVLGGIPLRSHNDIAALFDLRIFEQVASFTLVAELDLASPIRLEGADMESLRVTVQDDLTGLVRARLAAVGVKENVRT